MELPILLALRQHTIGGLDVPVSQRHITPERKMFATMTDDTKTWWSDQIKSLGFPIVVCVALMYGGYNIFTIFITPTFQKQMQTLDAVTETQVKMVDKLETMATDISIHKQILTELTSSQKDALVTLKDIEKNTSK